MNRQSIYQRESRHDRRIRRGDDFAGDAWRDPVSGRIFWVAVGRNPNDRPANPYTDPDHGLCATVTARHFVAVLLGMMLFTAVLLGALDRVLTAGLVRDAAALPTAVEQPIEGGES